MRLKFKDLEIGDRFYRESDVDGVSNIKIPLSYAESTGKFNSVTTAWGGEDEPMNIPYYIKDEEIVYKLNTNHPVKIVKFKNSDYSSRANYDN